MLLPVLTGSSVIIPIVMHLKEHPPEEEGSSPLLMVVFKPVTANSAIALFDTEVSHIAVCLARFCELLARAVTCRHRVTSYWLAAVRFLRLSASTLRISKAVNQSLT